MIQVRLIFAREDGTESQYSNVIDEKWYGQFLRSLHVEVPGKKPGEWEPVTVIPFSFHDGCKTIHTLCRPNDDVTDRLEM